jgi:hypothetical protein
MKNRIGIIALGQCGGNIGSIFETYGYNCLFINTSKEDLSTLNVKYRFHIPESSGAAHDREKAITLASKHYLRIIDEVKDKFESQNLIYLCFGTGGGTGSGLAPMLLEMLNSKFPNKHFGCIAVLPSESEMPKIQMNAFQCYKEISNIDKLASVFTLDNNKQVDKFKLNRLFVQKFDLMLDSTDHVNIKGNIDKAELFKMLTTRGNFYISTFNSTSNDNIISSIIKSWENSDVFADIERDKQITYIGLSLVQEVDIESLQKVIGTPFDVFQNVNRDLNITILSGLTFPKTRINKIIEKINSKKEIIKNNITNALTNKIVDTIDFVEEIERQQIDIDLKNLEEILSKYTA